MRDFVKLTLFVILFGVSLHATDTQAPGENHLELATMMYYDGNYTKAAAELAAVDRNGEKFDPAKFHSLKGLVAMKQNRYDEAIRELKKAIEATKVKVYVDPYAAKEKARKHIFLWDFKKKQKKRKAFDPEKIRKQKLEQLYLFLSRAYYRNKEYANAIKALEKAGAAGRNRPGLYLYKADCYWKMGAKDRAFATLEAGSRKFTKDISLKKQKFYYLAKLNLYHAAAAAAESFLEDRNTSAKAYITVAQVFLRAGEKPEAIRLLEKAKFRYDDEPKIPLLLGNIYLKEAMLHTPAQLFEESALIDDKYIKDAVEMYRRAREIPHAWYLNAKNPDPKEQLRQKIALLVSEGAFEKLIGLRSDMARYGLLQEDTIRYALAYAYYMVKDYANAEKNLKKITDNQLFSKATIIRKNIERCKEKPMECL